MTPADGGAAGDWIEWSGGECPVAPDTSVQIKTADGEVWDDPEGTPAGVFSAPAVLDWWKGEGLCHDWRIVAYRVVQP